MKTKLLTLFLLIPFLSWGQVAETIKSASGKDMTPVGVVQMYIATNAPSGWLICNGQAVGTNQSGFVCFD